MTLTLALFPILLEELYRIIDGVKEDLRREKKRFADDLKIGVMLETPAAALSADQFAQHCDFFSVGTNDLVQYTMAVDRGNERVASLYRPFHPVILRLIRNIVKAAENAGIWVSVCGEMASDPFYIPLLTGLGIRELSMSPVSLAQAKQVIRKMKYLDAELLVNQALSCNSQDEVIALSKTFLQKISPEIADSDNTN